MGGMPCGGVPQPRVRARIPDGARRILARASVEASTDAHAFPHAYVLLGNLGVMYTMDR
jgi:hypothetical protein